MKKSTKYESTVKDAKTLESVIPKQLAEYTTRALSKLNEALGGDVGGYVANRLHMSHEELREALAAEQIDGVALAIYNIEKRGQSVVIGDQTGIGKGRQAAAMIRYGLLSGYLPKGMGGVVSLYNLGFVCFGNIILHVPVVYI